MEARSLQRQGRAPEDIWRLCAIATTTFDRSLPEDREGGIATRTAVPLHRRQSPLAD